MPVEALLVALTLLIGASPFLLRNSCTKPRRPSFSALSLGVGLSFTAGALLWSDDIRGDPRSRPEHRPIEVQEGGYVSSNACHACHPHHYDKWHASYHRTMTQVASAESVTGRFDGEEVVYRGRSYRFLRDENGYWVEMDDPEHEGESGVAPRVRRKIVMTTGSHHMQVYWMETGEGRKLEQMPFDFNFEVQRWIPDHASYLRPPLGPREPLTVSGGQGGWHEHCIKCHVTRGVPKIEPEPEIHPDSRAVEFGIACEACHGPGGEHVRVNSNPARRYSYHDTDRADLSIVNPRRLDHVRSSQVCGQCHSIFLLDEQAFRDWAQQGFAYEPGSDLTDSRLIYQGHLDVDVELEKESSFWSDGFVRVSGREYNGLLETPCYQRGEMSCLSCHVMHQPEGDPRPTSSWTNDQLTLEMDGDEACLQCHESYRRDIEAHTHHRAGSEGSRCYNCHMPYTTYGLLKAIRSHTVDAPSVASSLETGRPNACNSCHLDRPLSWTAEFLERWYDIRRPPMSADEQSIAASILWSVRGDAGQRALMAWAMGWKPAQRASGTDWLLPYLSELLLDPYDAVRFIAHRSARTLPGAGKLAYDFLGSPAERMETVGAWRQTWLRKDRSNAGVSREHLLIDANGMLRMEVFDRLLKQRDHRPILLNE